MATLYSFKTTDEFELLEMDPMNSFINSETAPLVTSVDSASSRRWSEEVPYKDCDSLDYDICYNVPYKHMVRGYSKKTYWHMQLMRWVLVGIIGFLTGTVAFMIDICVRQLFSWKYGVFDKVYQATVGDGSVFLGLVILLGFNVVFAIIAGLLTAIEPVAAGSGIPEIKCYLNGIRVPHVTRISTLIAKAVGVLFSVAGGFFVGKEGPMIHSGAIIGAGVPQFRSMLFKWLKLPYPYFRSDRDKRDFVSSGAAAGVAAAFGAPIGGVLFSLEEGSSFWNQALTWRTLFCSFCSTFALNLLLSPTLHLKFGLLGAPSLVDFGTFSKDEKSLWNAYHLVIFIIMGAVGGLLGALFNSLNTQLTLYRMMYMQRRTWSRMWKVFEAVLIAIVTTFCVFLTAMLLGTCVPTHPNDARDACATGDTSFKNETKDYFCPEYGDTRETRFYNDMGTLLFNSQEIAIKQLFHQSGAFSLPTLGILFILYFFLACWTYGAGIPSGLFIPSLLVGAVYGRFVATMFGYLSKQYHFLAFLSNLYPGTYALIGAASFLGGVVRMTISLTVILIESTNEIEYGLPIMLTLMVSKWVGDIFNEGLYDIHIEVKKTPLLGWDSPDHMEKLIAEDVMNREVRYMFPITRVRSVVQLLRTTAHSAFLIVTPVDIGTIPERPHNVTAKHTPQLYARPSFTEEETTDFDSDGDHKARPDTATTNPFSVNDTVDAVFSQSTRTRSTTSTTPYSERKSRVRTTIGSAYPTLYREPGKVGLALSYTLPDHSKGMGIVRTYTDEQPKEKLLIFHGTILRSQLVMLLKNEIFFDEDSGPDTQPDISHLELTADYPRYPNIFDVTVGEQHRNKLMDLSIFMNPCPYTISNQAPLPQVFNLFRTMGLRHLPVIRESGIVVGIITRHDLTHERLHELRHEKKLKRKGQRKRRVADSLINNPVDDVNSATSA